MMRKRNYLNGVILLAAALLMLGGCSNSAKKKLGLGRHSPDEFAVVKRAPLSLPPVYNLRPPRPGAARPQAEDTTEQAKSAVFGGNGGATMQQTQPQQQPQGDYTSGEASLLGKVGTTRADPAIREKLEREGGSYSVRDENLADKVMFWKDTDAEAPASVVDAEAEAKRIKENQETGKDINEGDVPVIEPKKRAPLEGLFD